MFPLQISKKRWVFFCLYFQFILVWGSTLFAQNAPVIVQVDANANKRPINPLIYGVAHADAATLGDLNSPLNRNGGNNTSRYNWQSNADNRGGDWYFESIGDSSSVPGERGDTFISNSKAAGAQPMLTIPMLDWVARVGNNRSKLASFSIAKYGAQTGNDWQWYPDAGNGILASTGQNVIGNNPADANTSSNSTFQQGWVQHLVTRWGTAEHGGLRHYILDNEPSLWHSTHRDVHPTGATMDEILNKMITYASDIRAVDPSASIVGPEEWGWSGYFFSGYDQQWGSQHGWSNLPDRTNHGGWDYVPWLLNQLRQHDLDTGQRLLDVFSLHYYPQGGEFSNDTSSSMQQRRNRSTRSLWDPNYTDESWIADKVMLIPRMKSWVNNYYPNLLVAVTEYNWGAENHINGATAQADVFGIFGREGLDMATRWTTPSSATPTYKAMKMYRNYDGNKSTFGNTSVAAIVPNPDNQAAYAALRSSDGALTVMVISKVLTGNTPVTISMTNFSPQGIAQPWQLTAGNTINRLTDVNFSGSSFTVTIPPQSITLFVLSSSGATNQPPTAVISANPNAGTAPLNVTFNGNGSSDPDGTITTYSWNFGDGSSSSGVMVNHTYTNAGNYTCMLTVNDTGGASSSSSQIIVVNPDTLLNAPSSLSGSVSSRRVTLKWIDSSNNEQGFYVERALKTKSGTVFTRVGQVAANTTTYSETLSGGGTYLYRIQAFNQSTGKLSSYSNQVQLRVK